MMSHCPFCSAKMQQQNFAEFLVVFGRYGTKCGYSTYSKLSVANDVRIVLRSYYVLKLVAPSITGLHVNRIFNFVFFKENMSKGSAHIIRTEQNIQFCRNSLPSCFRQEISKRVQCGALWILRYGYYVMDVALWILRYGYCVI